MIVNRVLVLVCSLSALSCAGFKVSDPDSHIGLQAQLASDEVGSAYGVTTLTFPQDGMGLFFEARGSLGDFDYYDAHPWVFPVFQGETGMPMVVNVGRTLSLWSADEGDWAFGVYGGVGYAFLDGYFEFTDSDVDGGEPYLLDAEDDEGFNVCLGAVFRFRRSGATAITVSWDSFFDSTTVGLLFSK